jgi:hypothetical protein
MQSDRGKRRSKLDLGFFFLRGNTIWLPKTISEKEINTKGEKEVVFILKREEGEGIGWKWPMERE